jgi:hypothetical protein
MVALLQGQYLERIYGGEGGWREREAMKDRMMVWTEQDMCAGNMR